MECFRRDPQVDVRSLELRGALEDCTMLVFQAEVLEDMLVHALCIIGVGST